MLSWPLIGRRHQPSLPWQPPAASLSVQALGSFISEAICSESRIPEPFKQSLDQGKEWSPPPSHVCAHARKHTPAHTLKNATTHTHTTCMHTHAHADEARVSQRCKDRIQAGFHPALTCSWALVACFLSSPLSFLSFPYLSVCLCIRAHLISASPLCLCLSFIPTAVSYFACLYPSLCPISLTWSPAPCLWGCSLSLSHQSS